MRCQPLVLKAATAPATVGDEPKLAKGHWASQLGKAEHEAMTRKSGDLPNAVTIPQRGVRSGAVSPFKWQSNRGCLKRAAN